MERVIVSSEIEGIIDKENILGTDLGAEERNVRVEQEDRVFLGKLKKIYFSDQSTSLWVQVESREAEKALGFLNRKEKIVSIGDEISLAVTGENLRSFSMYNKKDMYIWKIIIDNSE